MAGENEPVRRVETADAGRHEFRAGAVFYGGVSLAVYENGVARAFFDAATAAGLFGPLLDLIDTRFIVDAVSGSSAGGINGLLLAAALERGYPFGKTAKLWREHGGIEDLLRSASDAGAPSLLRGDTYYLAQLRDAFRSICRHTTDPSYEAPPEIDVFVTGTDLAGVEESFVDAFGEKVPTRMHRLVFHLQHRQDRKDLGFLRQQPQDGSDHPQEAREATTASREEDRLLQADILAGVSRITSSFPGAFPPFTMKEFDEATGDGSGGTETTKRVRYALGRLCGYDLSHDPQLIDGGVLDNRPFGPVLDAVFHRMPFRETRGVTRRLFYVDPDPDVFKQEKQKRFSPLAVAVNSVVALPSYDSITSDVNHVLTHNARMAHLRQIRQRLAELPGRDEDTPVYRYALERELMGLLNGAELPTARDPDGADQSEIAATAGDVKALRKLDVGYHLRRAVSLFYGYASSSGAPAVDARLDPARCYAVGRVVKALKLLRDVWTSELRRLRNAGELPGMRRRLHVLELYSSGRWLPQSVARLSHEDLESTRLSALAAQARAYLQEQLVAATPEASVSQGSTDDPLSAAPGLLELLEQYLISVLGGRVALDDFARKDCSLYPLELASGTHELDEVKIIRISPDDPQLPRTESGQRISGHTKLTGDELAHFSAFLRRDFRTNDVAWGHVDGLDRIVRGLLDQDARQRASTRLAAHAEAFSVAALSARIEASCKPIPAALRPTLQGVLAGLERAFAACHAEGAELSIRTWRPFVDAFITAAQTVAACEYIHLIREDAIEQDRVFNWQEAPTLRLTEGSALQQLVALRRGETPVLQALPPSIVIEYAARAGLLLWGMIEQSLPRAKPLARARPYVVGLLSVVHAVAALTRTEERVAALIVFGIFVGSIVLMIATWFGAALKLLAVGLIGVAFCVLCTGFVRSMRWLRAVSAAATFVGLAAVVWIVVATRVSVRPPWGDKTYVLDLANSEEADAAGGASNGPLRSAAAN